MKARKVVLVDAIRTAFGRAGEKGIFWNMSGRYGRQSDPRTYAKKSKG